MKQAEQPVRSYSFTLRAWQKILVTTERVDFWAMDADEIFQTVTSEIRVVPFREYLKRYLYEKTGMFQPFARVPLSEYTEIVEMAFRESGTPCSFEPGKTRIQQAVRNWLTREDVSRRTMLLLGFGLYMTTEDVNAFLTKALHGAALDPDDPREAICLYCYEHGYRYDKFRQLWDLYTSMGTDLEPGRIEETQPEGRPQSKVIMEEDAALLKNLLRAKAAGGMTPAQSARASAFRSLYDRAYDTLASMGTKWSANPRSLERVLSASVPLGTHGNLVPETRAQAIASFARKRFSRQRVHRVLSGEQQPTRYDLLTLQFYLSSQRAESTEDRKTALKQFCDEAGSLLNPLGFCGMYSADPFDAFLILCMLTIDPLGSYSDVMEKAYHDSGETEPEGQP